MGHEQRWLLKRHAPIQALDQPRLSALNSKGLLFVFISALRSRADICLIPSLRALRDFVWIPGGPKPIRDTATSARMLIRNTKQQTTRYQNTTHLIHSFNNSSTRPCCNKLFFSNVITCIACTGKEGREENQGLHFCLSASSERRKEEGCMHDKR